MSALRHYCTILLTLVSVCQAISGAYFVAAAQSLFTNLLLQTIGNTAANIDPIQVINTGATEIQHIFKGEDLHAVLEAYMVGIKDVFAFALAGGVLSVLLALMIPLKRLPDHGNKQSEEA